MADIISLDPSINNFAVFGNPVSHSKSPQIHTLFAKQTGLSLHYQSIEIPLGKFTDSVKAFSLQGGKGLNITVPFKEEAYSICTSLTKRAKLAGSVNTIWFGDDSSIYGDTTDGQGLINDLTKNHNLNLKNKSLLVLGAGGSVKSILEPLLKQEPERIVIANRTLTKAESLSKKFSKKGNIEVCSYNDLSNQSFDLIINGTSLSLHDELPPLPDTILNKNSCCYDLMYADEATVFMKWAIQNGAVSVLDGLGMLVEQAAESFNLWHGIKPATKPVIEFLRNNQTDGDVGC